MESTRSSEAKSTKAEENLLMSAIIIPQAEKPEFGTHEFETQAGLCLDNLNDHANNFEEPSSGQEAILEEHPNKLADDANDGVSAHETFADQKLRESVEALIGMPFDEIFKKQGVFRLAQAILDQFFFFPGDGLDIIQNLPTRDRADKILSLLEGKRDSDDGVDLFLREFVRSMLTISHAKGPKEGGRVLKWLSGLGLYGHFFEDEDCSKKKPRREFACFIAAAKNLGVLPARLDRQRSLFSQVEVGLKDVNRWIKILKENDAKLSAAYIRLAVLELSELLEVSEYEGRAKLEEWTFRLQNGGVLVSGSLEEYRSRCTKKKAK
jgi:hypothetical protein